MNIFKLLNLWQDFVSGGASPRDKASIVLKCDGSSITFPVIPADLPVVEQSQNNSIFNSFIGDMANIGLMGLRSVKLENYFVPSDTSKYSFARGDNASDIINFINQNRPNGKPFTLCITKGHVTYLNIDVLLNNFSYHMTNTSDYVMNLEFTEYVRREVMPT